jgi:hypothetical protein
VSLAQNWAQHGRVLFVVPTEARAAAARKALLRPWVFGGGPKAIDALRAEVARLGAALVLDCALVGHADFGALRDMTLSANGPMEQARARSGRVR